jgi:hypothetical protein
VQEIIADWPSAQRNIAEQMIAKYGFPNEVNLGEKITMNGRPIMSNDVARKFRAFPWTVAIPEELCRRGLIYSVLPAFLRFMFSANLMSDCLSDRARRGC